MIRLGKSIRLTRREVERFTKITGFEPVNVRTLDDLDRYIRKCKAHFWGCSEDTRFLHFLIDEELRRNLSSSAIDMENDQRAGRCVRPSGCD